jgi:glycosyltransferase involved in cell wall biosynthesis
VTPLAIVHIESSLGWGGQEIRILSESQGLIRRGHDVRLICPPEARIFAEAKNWGVPASALPIARKRPVGVKVMFEWLKRNRCDVVSTHSSTDSWLAAFALLALGRPVRMVRTRHISAPVSRNVLSRWLYTRATSRIVTAGEALRRELIEKNGFPAERIDSVPTGIDAQRFRPGERDAARAVLKLPRERTLVGIVATLRDWKGHRYLIEAVAQLPESVGLVIVGDGPMREALQADVARRAMGGRVWFAGNQRDVLPWLQALDVFALPSYANEGVPQALGQAMLVGLACVTTHVGSIAELAKHAVTALVVPPRDVSALRSALEKLAGEPELRKRLGEEARRHCSEHFSFETMLDRMEGIYRQVSGRLGP